MKDRIINYIFKWESRCYDDGIPDVAHHRIESLNKAPSYKRIVKAILSNDVYLTSLGFSKPRCSAYDAIKYSELKDNGKIKQMDLFK